MLDNLKKYHIVLASNSPRRKELLGGLGISYEVKTLQGIEESYPDTLPPSEVAEYISLEKAMAYKDQIEENELLITADTVVVLGKEIMGKPKNAEDAERMLRELSGKVHQVYTGVTLMTKYNRRSFTSATDVKFADLSDDEIGYYVETYSPLDKAGAYGIQEWIGYAGVESIHGSYFNVMGLPIHRLYQELKKME
ncbi:MAG: Maf-like protein [Phocaeicola sp.]|uniref:Maf-like protein n=1 Tax=Phocaeicola TaxID=909656 RepID=UPI00234E40D0|nr:Maf-like protein [Phocaeicola oris]MCE2616700.1 Maf-like protein [Phocaeicola oris]